MKENNPANNFSDTRSVIIKVTGAGTLTLDFTGTSNGSDMSFDVGEAQLHAVILN